MESPLTPAQPDMARAPRRCRLHRPIVCGRVHVGLAWLLATGCGRADQATVDSSGGSEEDGGGDDTILEPVWGPDDIVENLDEAFAVGLPDVIALRDDFKILMDAGDDDCPGPDYDLFFGEIPVAGCMSTTGYHYLGAVDLRQGDEFWSFFEVGEGVEPGDGYSLQGSLLITPPDGRAFLFGGIASYSALRFDGGDSRWTSELNGTFQDERLEPPLADGVSASIGMSGGHQAIGDFVELNGGLAQRGFAINFDGVYWELGACSEPTRGTVHVRDPGSSWFTLEVSSECGQCPTLSWADGSELGELCVDLGQIAEAAVERMGVP